MHCGHLPWQGAHTTNQNRDSLRCTKCRHLLQKWLVHGGSNMFQLIPTAKEGVYHCIGISWRRRDCYRDGGAERGYMSSRNNEKHMIWITWITATDGKSYPDLLRANTGGYQDEATRWVWMLHTWMVHKWHTQSMMYVNDCQCMYSLYIHSFIETWRNCRCVINKTIIQNHRCVGIMSLASSWSWSTRSGRRSTRWGG